MPQEDRRGDKTRRTLKRALIAILQTKPFEDILVKDICLGACVSRVTFYNYYNDKTDLLKEIFSDMDQDLSSRLAQKGVSFSGEQPPSEIFAEVISSIIEINKETRLSFANMELAGNSEVLSMYFHFLVKNTAEVLEKLSGVLKPNYPLDRLAVFIVFGLYGYLHCDSQTKDEKPEKVVESAERLAADLINSGIFAQKKKKKSNTYIKMAQIAGAVSIGR
ncbi:MAG: TetR/AcrR family transcriptional regulator [Pyramidobacter sp.]